MSRLDKYSNKPAPSRNVKDRGGLPFTTALAVQFGGFLVQFGAIFFAFGMIFWWVFGAQSDVTSWYKFAGNLAQADGRVTAVESTGVSEGGGDHSPGVPIYRVFYEFEAGGVMYHDKCYGTGFNPDEGSRVEVEYKANDPVTSRVKGTRKGIIGFWGIFVAMFPGLGLVFMVSGLLRNARTARLLRVGKLARGRLVDKQATGTKINNATVYKFTFEFEDEGGDTHRVTGKTHHTRLLEDEETERLIYHPNRPDHGAMVDILPGRPKVDPQGRLQGVGMIKAGTYMLLPIGGIGAHGLVGALLYVF